MNILIVAPNYPYAGHPFSGTFNENSAQTLTKLCDQVEVLIPRAYVPRVLTLFRPRWKAYASAPRYEKRNAVPVYRPPTPVIPRIAQAFWTDQGSFVWCRGTARRMHERTHFDAIISFGLLGAGALAWRIARELDIPAGGWATGSDVRVLRSSSFGRSVARALRRLDIVFYQSHELRERAAALLGMSLDSMSAERHLVLPRGIPEPPALCKNEIRSQMRRRLKIPDGAIVVLNVGRVSRDKGILELLEGMSIAVRSDPRLVGVVVGSMPAFDETRIAHKKVEETAGLRGRVKIMAACPPEEVWQYLCAADIFAFASHNEGMPNCLLEAMAMGVPSVAFAIPAVQEIEAGTGGVVLVPPRDTRGLAIQILRLAARALERSRVGERGQQHVRERFMMKRSMAEAIRRLAMRQNPRTDPHTGNTA